MGNLYRHRSTRGKSAAVYEMTTVSEAIDLLRKNNLHFRTCVCQEWGGVERTPSAIIMTAFK